MTFEITEHIAVQVNDHTQAAKFYQKVFGMQVKEEKEGETVMQCGPYTLYVESSPKNHTFFEFRTDNIAVAKEKLMQEGCMITKVNNEKSMMVEDPFGLRFHLWEK